MEGLELSKEEINEIFDKNQLHLQTSPNGLHSSFCKLDYISLQPQQLLRTEAINLISSMLYEKFIENCSAIGGIDDYRSYIRLLDVFLVTLIMST